MRIVRGLADTNLQCGQLDIRIPVLQSAFQGFHGFLGLNAFRADHIGNLQVKSNVLPNN